MATFRRLGSALWGYFLFAFGTLLLGWVFFNLFVELQPAAEGRTPAPAALAGALMVLIGIRRVTDSPWYTWSIWKSAAQTWTLVLFLVVFGLAYALNVIQRLQHPAPGLLLYATIFPDLAFLSLLIRIVWLVLRIFLYDPFNE